MSAGEPRSRRSVLTALAVLGSAAVATVLAPAGALAKRRRKRKKKARKALGVPPEKRFIVYRFRTRRRHACRACRKHRRYKMFLTHALANGHRAHPGCNCPIVPHQITRKSARLLFVADTTGVVDLRQVTGRRA
jgi:hypothetical protein